MIRDKTQVLIVTMKRLLGRGAEANIRRILQKNHAADIAAILESLSPEDKIEVFNLENSFDKKAETFSYLQTDSQEDILKRLTQTEISKLISLLEPDDAADTLGILPKEEAQAILASMKRSASEDVAGLMAYPDDSAGGLMNSDFLSVNQNLSVGETIKEIQSEENESRVAFYIYVVNDNNRLEGVISLKQLLLSKKTDLLKNIMESDVVSVDVSTDQTEVAKVVERYDFLSVPIVDSGYILTGVVTVDDVIDVIREEAEEGLLQMGRVGLGVKASLWSHFKARFFWLMLSFSVGIVCFFILDFMKGQENLSREMNSLWYLVSVIPLLLALGKTAGVQATTVIVGAIRGGSFDVGNILDFFLKELWLSLLFSFCFTLLAFIFGWLVFEEFRLVAMVTFSVGVHTFLCVVMGALIAIGLYRMGSDPTTAAVPIFNALSILQAIFLLFLSDILFF